MKTRNSGDVPDLFVLRTVFYYCLAIIVCPVASFFGSKYFLFDGVFGSTQVLSNVYSAVFAVVVLHIALGFFIYRAYSDPWQVPKPDKQD